MKKVFVSVLLICVLLAGCGTKDSLITLNDGVDDLYSSDSQTSQENDDGADENVTTPDDDYDLDADDQISSSESTESITDIIAEKGSDTPEEAAQGFAEAISNNDVFTALSFFDCAHKAENYDYSAIVDRMQSWQPNLTYAYDSSEEMFMDAAYAVIMKDAVYKIFNMCFSLEADEEYLQMRPMIDDIETIISDLDRFTELDALDTFRIVRMDLAKPEAQRSSSFQNAVNANSRSYGTEDYLEYGVLYEYNGNTYLGGMMFFKYDGKWYIDSPNSALAGQSAFGYLTPMSEEEYLEQVSD